MTGDELKGWRKRNNFTQQKLGLELGVARQTVLTWEQSSQSLPRMLVLALRALESGGSEVQSVVGQRASVAEYQRIRRQRRTIEGER